MRILIFSVTFWPFIGGAELAQEEILKRLPDINATVITARLRKNVRYEERLNNTIYIKRVGLGMKIDKYLYPFLAYRLAVRLHRERPFHINQAIMANYAGLAAVFFKWTFPDVPYLLTMQSGDSPLFIWLRTWWFYPLYKCVYTKADYIQAISRYLVKRAKQYGYKGPYSVIPNGVAYGLFQRRADGVVLQELRKKLGIDANDKVIVTVSRLVHKNGIDILIRGFHVLISQHNIRAQLIIIGIGKKERSLRRLAKHLHIDSYVHFLGFISYNELPPYLQLADVFVRPSRSEGMGNAFIEAMAAGIPVIGTAVGGIPDFLTHRQTGLLCDKDNPDSIARAINECIDNKSLREKIISQSRALIKEKYDWKSLSNVITTIYNKLL